MLEGFLHLFAPRPVGDVIIEVGGKQVEKPADVRDALVAAQKAGLHDVLMRVKTAQAGTRFVAVPIG